jgi:UPF0755 protein
VLSQQLITKKTKDNSTLTNRPSDVIFYICSLFFRKTTGLLMAKQKSHLSTKLFRLLSVLVLGIGVATGYLFNWANTETSLQEKQVIDFTRGTSLTALSIELESKEVVTSGLLFKVYTKFFGGFHNAQAGRYAFKGSVSPVKVIAAILSGKTYRELIANITIPEGFTIDQVLRRLEANKVGTYKSLKKLAFDPKFISSLGVKASNLEGYIYPETYSFFEVLPTGEQALRQMVKEFFKQLPKDYASKIKSRKLNLTEAITFASLIEKETMLDEERPLVSEVIWNRLNKNMQLGIDAAIIYGIKDYDGDLKWKDLKNKKNPYNTRIHRGLPPGPIGAVNRASLEAVLNPSNYGYYYYVLIPRTNGKHHFSKTLKEHNKHVKKLVNYSRQKK